MKNSGQNVTSFFSRFPDENACLEHIFKTKWGDHSPCPSCGEIGGWGRVRNQKKYFHICRRQFSPLEGTVFYRSNLSLMAWFYTILLFSNCTNGMQSTFVRRQLGVGLKGAWRMCDRVRVHIAAYDRPEQIGGEGVMVYIDETFLKQIVPRIGEARGSVVVFGMATDKQVISGLVQNRKQATLFPIIERYIRPGSILVTDGCRSYFSLERRGWEHIVVDHSKAFHNFQGVTLNPIEVYWSCLKRSLRGCYRQVAIENLWKFLAEIEFRYNRRNSTSPLFDELISAFPLRSKNYDRNIQERYDWRCLRL